MRDRRAELKAKKELKRAAKPCMAKITEKFPDEGKSWFRFGDGSRYRWDAEGKRWRCARCGWGVVPGVLYRPQFAHDKECGFNPERRSAKRKKKRSA